MRTLGSLIAILLLTACSGEREPSPHQWFTTYQTDRSCQNNHPLTSDEDIKGPTGRAHPF